MDVFRLISLNFEIEPLSSVHIEHLLPSGTDPLGGDADEAADEALEPAGDLKAFELRGNCFKDI